MSHHLSKVAVEAASDRTVVVEQAPPDSPQRLGSAAAPAAASSAAPAATPSGAAPSGAGSSGMTGANVPVDSVQSASTQIRSAQTDLTSTSTAPRRLDGLDGVGGGGGGGGGGNGNNGAAVQTTGDGQVAAGTAQQDVSQTGLGGETTDKQVTGDAITIGAATDGGGADPTATTTGQ